MTSDNIYLSHRGETLGPYSREEIEARVKSGRITSETLMWHEGMSEWARFEDLDRATQDKTEKTMATSPSALPIEPPSRFRRILTSLFKYRTIGSKPISFWPHVISGLGLCLVGLPMEARLGLVVICIGLDLAYVAIVAGKRVPWKHTLSIAVFSLCVLLLLAKVWMVFSQKPQAPAAKPLPISEVNVLPSGLMVGSCKNLTVGLDGYLKLMLMTDGSKVEGLMSVSGWLISGCAVTGTRNGNQYFLQVQDPATGIDTHWRGVLSQGKLSGDYVVKANVALGLPQQVGQWEVSPTRVKGGETEFKDAFMFACEILLNQPVATPQGQVITGAQSLFNAIHPVGAGVSVQITDVLIDWKPGTSKDSLDGVRGFTLDYLLFWHGVVQPTGWTRLRLTYDYASNTLLELRVLESTGTTNSEMSEMAFGLGFFLGEAMMKEALNGR